MIKASGAMASIKLVPVLIVLSAVFASGCGLLGVVAGGRSCHERADYENDLVREALRPALSEGDLVATMEDWNDCDSSTFGAHVKVHIEDVTPKEVVAAFGKAGWSSEPASERTRDCTVRCEAYDLTKRFGERVVEVLVEGDREARLIASAADHCWDADGYACPGGTSR
ncbi:hypothetical protein ACQEUU_00520 [Nonomuraea sp. CA-218870]|uniref:Lipoprotein n=1 Tax=Nonomuraea corallina TaxID=2989783 RepID=A0ABT4S4U7_9ACTN|nr:hypothetical protein [Nonomuraea corallina]MDA0632233.1 hypothetical protein [Nonomuraea corallina]